MTGPTSCTENSRTQRHQKSALLHTFFFPPKKKENPEASKIFVLCCKAKRAPCTVCPVFFFLMPGCVKKADFFSFPPLFFQAGRPLRDRYNAPRNKKI